MILCRLHFECYQDTQLGAAEEAIGLYLAALRDQGQIQGREFATLIAEGGFQAHVLCPEPQSLHPDFASHQVQLAERGLHQAGLLAPKIKRLGQELFSDETDPCAKPDALIVFTSFLHTCSPIRCAAHFAPVPLYRLPSVSNGDQKQLVQWQEDWQACDQLQMNGSVLQHAATREISELDSDLSRRGRKLAQRLAAQLARPVYYYLYRLGGTSLTEEKNRRCPGCGGAWRLDEPWHGLFDFCCPDCQLVSNLSWGWRD